MRFATVADGVGAVDARRARGEHDVLLDLEDKPLLIRAAIPEVGALMRELEGVWRVPYDAALIVTGGFIEAPLRAPAMPRRLWGELCLAPHRMQAAWRAALPLVFSPDAAPETVPTRSAFGWYSDAKELRSQLPVEARVLDPDGDFYAVEAVPALAADADGAVRRERAALLAEWPLWLDALEFKRGSAFTPDGSLDVVVLLEHLLAPRFLFIQRTRGSNFSALLGAIEAAAADASLAPASRGKMRAPALASSVAAFIREIYPDPVFAAFHESSEAREAQLQFLCELAAVERGSGSIDVFLNASHTTCRTPDGALLGLGAALGRARCVSTLFTGKQTRLLGGPSKAPPYLYSYLTKSVQSLAQSLCLSEQSNIMGRKYVMYFHKPVAARRPAQTH